MKLNRTLISSAAIAALGGLLFGFDTIVISGAEQKFQALWNLSDTMHGWAMSSALWGTVLGALLGNIPTDRFGRKGTLIWIGLLFFLSAVWSGLATGPYTFMIARFIGGLGVGISTVASPLYISEISPAKSRGFLTGLFQFNIVFGILLAFVSNSLLEDCSKNDWRWMLGVEGFPAIVYTISAFFIPESPRWLIGLKHRREEGKAVLVRITRNANADDIERLVGEIEAASNAEEQVTGGAIFSKRLKTPIIIAFFVALFNQLSGINAILYFAPRILRMAGLSDPRLGQIGIGLVNLVFTMLGLWLIDRAGRRSLLLIGSIGYVVSLSIVAATFFANEPALRVAGDAQLLIQVEERLQAAQEANGSGAMFESIKASAARARAGLDEATHREEYQGERTELGNAVSSQEIIAKANEAAEEAVASVGNSSLLVLFGIFAFIASHAVGQGAVIWVLISEVFPNEHRAIGNSIGCGTHWVCAAVITLFFPVAVSNILPGYVFSFFACMMVLQFFWVLIALPETKGVPLEEIQKRLRIT